MFNPRPNDKVQFTCVPEGEALILRLQQKGMFGEKDIPVDQWHLSAPETMRTLAYLQTLAENKQDSEGADVIFAETSLRLNAACIANMDSVHAATLGLPPPTPLALSLKSQGLFHEPGFYIQADWIRPGGGAVRAHVTGALIDHGAGIRRLPGPVFELYQIARQLAHSLAEAERFDLVARLQALLPEAAAESFRANGLLTETRIHYAAAFSLKLGRSDPFDFDPVFFSRASRDISSDGQALNEDGDSLLTEAQQKIFTEQRFRTNGDIKPAYPLRHGQYIFIDPALRPVLREVRRLQGASLAERQAFIFHPQRVLRDRLGDQIAETSDLEHLFIETEQFSARVAGVAPWSKPVLPWIKPTPNHWLPEKFGLKIGDETMIEMAAEDIRPLSEAIDLAMTDGHTSVPYKDINIPATAQARQALMDLEPFAPFPTGFDESTAVFDGPPPILSEKKFLVVKENFEDLEYVGFDRSTTLEAIGPLVLPDLIRSQPKAHQTEGIDWLRRRYLSGKNGALLADDMGLGKTFQAIAFMACMRAHKKAQGLPLKPCLIVAPTGLLANWRREIDLHLDAPALGDVILAFGANLRQLREDDGFKEKDIEAGRASLQASAWQQAGLVLTTYETLRDYQFSFAKSPFELVIFDEVQKLKNPASQLTSAAKTVNAAFALGMTGTPVENRLQDLWSITDVLMPGFLGLSRDFDRRYPSHDLEALKRLRARLCDSQEEQPPYMLRRMKSDHLPDMPSKTAIAQRTFMPQQQADAYAHLVRRAMAGRANLSKQDGILQILHEMRSVSLHPEQPSMADDAYVAQSARLIWMVKILEDIRSKNEKVLIFLEALDMQEALAHWLKQRFGLKVKPGRIHGGVPGPKRQTLVDTFQDGAPGFDIMILSPRAGGVGLTLTAANHVIHLSRWWNPAVEDQSTDRVYRIGQRKPVHVYYPLAVHPELGGNSFDVKLNDLLERKRSLSRDILLPPEGDEADITQLFDSVSQMETVPAATGNTPDKPVSRPTLSLKSPPPTALPKKWKFPEGKPADLTALLALFSSLKVKTLEISDPYALADRGARQAQMDFIAAFKAAIKTPLALTIEYNPQHSEPQASDDEVRYDFFRVWSQKFGDHPSPNLVCRGRTRDRDFHDRFIYITTEGAGGARLKHELSLTRGLLGVMSARFACVVTYFPPFEAEI